MSGGLEGVSRLHCSIFAPYGPFGLFLVQSVHPHVLLVQVTKLVVGSANGSGHHLCCNPIFPFIPSHHSSTIPTFQYKLTTSFSFVPARLLPPHQTSTHRSPSIYKISHPHYHGASSPNPKSFNSSFASLCVPIDPPPNKHARVGCRLWRKCRGLWRRGGRRMRR